MHSTHFLIKMQIIFYELQTKGTNSFKLLVLKKFIFTDFVGSIKWISILYQNYIQNYRIGKSSL